MCLSCAYTFRVPTLLFKKCWFPLYFLTSPFAGSTSNRYLLIHRCSHWIFGHVHFKTYKRKILVFTLFFVFSIASLFLIVFIWYFQMLLYMDQSLLQWKNRICMLFFYGYIWIFTFRIHISVHPGFWEFMPWYFHFYLHKSW